MQSVDYSQKSIGTVVSYPDDTATIEAYAVPTATQVIGTPYDLNLNDINGEILVSDGSPPMQIPDVSHINETTFRNLLFTNGWPLGLQTTLLNGIKSMPMRFFICDDSGSMLTADGKRVAGTGRETKYDITTYDTLFLSYRK